MQLELTIGERCPQRNFQGTASVEPAMHLRLKEPIRASTIRLGCIQSQIGMPQQLVGIASIARRHRDADAHIDII